MTPTTFTIELRPRLPQRLARLAELAENLLYSWDHDVRRVFVRLDRALWHACGNNPKLLLRRLPQATLDHAAEDRDFLDDYSRALAAYDDYLQAAPRHELAADLDPERDLVAYFCAEFGVHESLPIYSGGLGILAGDHCKAASDLELPFVAVGLLYRLGYFTQHIDAHGRQHALPHPVDFDELPLSVCRDAHGAELRVPVEIAERSVQLRVWQARVGRVRLYLLDADVPENDPAERAITHQLYGGDADTRIRQEIVLGVGGVRALRLLRNAAADGALPRDPTVFHMNEGHAAFLILERLREEAAAGRDFDAALERVAAANVFTTHTPVPSGHDVFQNGQVRWFLQKLLPQLGAAEERLLALGSAEPADPHHGRFNMTTLALRGSRLHNGVSKIHGGVASRMERALWPQLAPEDNPIGHVTNGVHFATFIAPGWVRLFHEQFSDWRSELRNPQYWRHIDGISDERFAEVRRECKRALLADLARRLDCQLARGGVPAAIAHRVTHLVKRGDTEMLVLGFARRFATYKRATLLLSDEARLARLLNDRERPALLVFAGKAHPKDQPGQALIQKLYETAMKPEFIGRLLVVEGYDMSLARRLVQGCDVWLNNPEHPLEASGTSGEKAGINGTVNLSVLDGWWDEAYVGEGPDAPNGFAVRPVDPRYWSHLHDEDAVRRHRDEEECRQLLDLLEDEVRPRYFAADGRGYGPEWLRVARNSMKTLIPRFNAARMVSDYVQQYYAVAARQGRKLREEGAARALSEWKKRVRAAWPGVQLRAEQPPPAALEAGQKLGLRALAWLNGLAPEDVAVECLLGHRDVTPHRFEAQRTIRLTPAEQRANGFEFQAEIDPLPGLQHLRLRLRPAHALLTHPLELGLSVWA